jgi:hypothetical protein
MLRMLVVGLMLGAAGMVGARVEINQLATRGGVLPRVVKRREPRRLR